MEALATTIEALEIGVDHGASSQPPKPIWQIFGHNDNLLDVIVPEKRRQVIWDDIEDIGRHGGRAITVTFTDKHLSMYSKLYLEQSVNKDITHTRGVIKSRLISEYSATGRFHLHGALLTKDLKTLSNVKRKMSKYGICKIKVIDDSPGWATYCVKQVR